MGRWITLQEARDRTGGEWWNQEGPPPNNDLVEVRQYCAGAPIDRPIYMDNECMYLGEWENGKWHGFGVCYRRDGRLLVGRRIFGVLHGPVLRTWMGSCRTWRDNYDANSNISTLDGVPIPYIYIGNFNTTFGKHDTNATVILSDGSIHHGPWANNDPVGDFWQDHVCRAQRMSVIELDGLLGGSEQKVRRDYVPPPPSPRFVRRGELPPLGRPPPSQQYQSPNLSDTIMGRVPSTRHRPSDDSDYVRVPKPEVAPVASRFPSFKSFLQRNRSKCLCDDAFL